MCEKTHVWRWSFHRHPRSKIVSPEFMERSEAWRWLHAEYPEMSIVKDGRLAFSIHVNGEAVVDGVHFVWMRSEKTKEQAGE